MDGRYDCLEKLLEATGVKPSQFPLGMANFMRRMDRYPARHNKVNRKPAKKAATVKIEELKYVKHGFSVGDFKGIPLYVDVSHITTKLSNIYLLDTDYPERPKKMVVSTISKADAEAQLGGYKLGVGENFTLEDGTTYLSIPGGKVRVTRWIGTEPPKRRAGETWTLEMENNER